MRTPDFTSITTIDRTDHLPPDRKPREGYRRIRIFDANHVCFIDLDVSPELLADENFTTYAKQKLEFAHRKGGSVQPVLTSREWEDAGRGVGGDPGGLVYELSYIGWIETERRIPAAMAILNNALLDSDPRKITREKLAQLRVVMRNFDGVDLKSGNYVGEMADSIIAFLDGLESLLQEER